MANEHEEITATDESAAARDLLDSAFGRLRELGSGDEPSRLFPNGVASVDLEITLGSQEKSGFHLGLKIAGAPANTEQAVFTVVEAEDDEVSVLFNTEGHHVIALVAMLDLETNSATALQRVQEILEEGDRTVLEAATFPDDIRDQQPQTKPFHYIDIPLKEGGAVNPPLPAPPHVLSKIEDFTEFLKSGGGSAQEKVDALSWIFHMFGDVHQPLHCIERISELHPGGDRGGNSFRLRGRARNLHSLWDSSVNVLASIGEEDLANEILQEHSRDSLATDLAVTDTEKWARASFNLAKRHAYALEENPQNPPKPPMSYLRNMEKIGHRQAALGGYRLSDRLKEIFG